MSILKTEKLHFQHRNPLNVGFFDVRNSLPKCHETALRFIYVMDGKISVFHDDRSYEAGKDDFIMIDYNTVYFIDSSSDNSTIILDLDLTNTAYDQEDLCKRFWYCNSTALWNNVMATDEAFDNMRNLIVAIASCSYYVNERFTEYSNGMCTKIIDALNDNFQWFKRTNTLDADSKKFEERFQKILVFVLDHYTERIKLKDVADHINVDPAYLSRMISTTPYVSFTTMLNTIRCWAAENMLLTTDLSVSEISFACGFSSEEYFRKQFSEIIDTMPGEFRKYIKRRAMSGEKIVEMSPHDIEYQLNKCMFRRFASSIFPQMHEWEPHTAMDLQILNSSKTGDMLDIARKEAKQYDILHDTEE